MYKRQQYRLTKGEKILMMVVMVWILFLSHVVDWRLDHEEAIQIAKMHQKNIRIAGR
jgi:cell division protein FtsL